MDPAPYELPRAETLNYWMTSKKGADSWVDKAEDEIEAAGGSVLGRAFGSEPQTGRSAFMLEFSLGGERFRIVWPVLPSDEPAAARRQAATMLYHDVKSRCVGAKIFGERVAFFSYLMLPDGRSATQIANTDLAKALPSFLSGQKALE